MKSPRRTRASEKRMKPQMEPWGKTTFKGQKEEEEPIKKTESPRTETRMCCHGSPRRERFQLSEFIHKAW